MTHVLEGDTLGQLVLDGRPLEQDEAIEVYAGSGWWQASAIQTPGGWRIRVPGAKPTSVLHGLGMEARRVAVG